MNIEELYQYCMNKKGVTEHFPFDKDTLVFKVGNKMFCLTSLKDFEAQNASVNLKSTPEDAIELREKYAGIIAGYHMNKTHWNTVAIGKDVPDDVVFMLIDNSYHLIFNSLPKKVKEEICTT